MTVAHHGAELPLVLAVLAGAGAASPLYVLMRARLAAAGGRLRRRASGMDVPRNHC